jgi:hypothetical protein
MRNPVGPLPSSIYWRRRAILASMVAVLALLITWVITSGGGGGGGNDADGPDGKNPTASITPGPSGSDPAISQAPGGRDESSEGGDGDGDSGSGGSGGSDGSTGSGGSDGSASGGSGSGGGGAGADGGEGGGGSGDTVPAGSTLPDCTPGSVKLMLRSVSNSYAPDEKPTFELIARNSSDSDCKLDLGPKRAVLTITQSKSDDEIWSSADCPTGAASILFRVPANDQVVRTVEWNRKASAPQCATPPALAATPGTYLVEAKAPDLPKSQISFVLKKD